MTRRSGSESTAEQAQNREATWKVFGSMVALLFVFAALPGGPTDRGLAQSTSAGLPHAIDDDNYLLALSRYHASVPQWFPLTGSFHEHTDVHVIDIKGHEYDATVDHWHRGEHSRDEERAPGFSWTVVWGHDQNWVNHDGKPSLRLNELRDMTPRAQAVERRIRILAKGYVKLKKVTLGGRAESCSDSYGGAKLCFDDATGFPVFAILDDEMIVFEEWSKYENSYYPSKMARFNRGKRLQMEWKSTVTHLDDVGTLFDPLPGVVPTLNKWGAYKEDKHKILNVEYAPTHGYGEAMVKVSVDENGRVRNVELLDADDKSLGEEAVDLAKNLVYEPQEVGGKRVPFETTHTVNRWSSVDPINVAETFRRSLSPD